MEQICVRIIPLLLNCTKSNNMMGHMTNLHSHLSIRGLDLRVNLGWRSKERAEEQAILLDMDIAFPEPPKACETDHLRDSVCYAAITETIRKQLGDKKFRLVEHLSRDIYHIVKPLLPITATLMVRVTKFPNRYIAGLTNGICFSYGDLSSRGTAEGPP
jgi:FolB domain-containing protein